MRNELRLRLMKLSARLAMLWLDIASINLDYFYEKNTNVSIRAKGRLIDAKNKLAAFHEIIEGL